MARIPQSAIDQVRARADIVQVIGRYVSLKKAGRQWVGLCPFHDEKTPSFSVSEEKQVFYCFGCQEGGNVISFVMKHGGLGFPEAVSTLARDLGVEIPKGEAEDGRTLRLQRLNDAALEFFRRSLRESGGRGARAHLEQRGIPGDLAERFQLGFAPARWDGLLDHLSRERLPVPAAAELGLVKRRETGDGFYDAFRGRVMFPIAEPGGRVIGFGGRALSDDGPKYINSPESPLYRKSRVLFGLPQAVDAIRARRRVVVVEGYFDVLALHRAGLAEAVAPCGTSLTAGHARSLRRYTGEVVLLFDGDAAGERAARRSLPLLLAEGLRVRAVFLPAGEDPDTIVRSGGPGALVDAVDGAVWLLDHLIEQALKDGADSPTGAADAARELAPFLRAVRDPVERAAYTRKLSSYLQLPADALARVVEEAEASRPGNADAARPPERPQRAELPRLDPLLRTLLAAVLACPEAARHLDALEGDSIDEPIHRDLLAVVSGAANEHGHAAVAQLLSPENDTLSESLRILIGHLVAHEPPDGDAAAERAVIDCVARLRERSLDAKIREVRSRLAACSDADESTALLEQQQQYMAQRRELRATIAAP